MMRAAIYARVSTPRQARAQKIDEQLERLQVYVEQKGCTLEREHVYLDEGYSGSRCLLRGLTVQRGPSDSPPQGATDGPLAPYPSVRPNGRRLERAFLPDRRRLRPPQPAGRWLRGHKAALGLRGPDPSAPATAQGRRERALVPQGRPAVLLSPVPRGRGPSHPSSLHRRVRRLRRFLEPLRRAVLEELVGEPETLIVDSTLLSVLHPRQVAQTAVHLHPGAWVVAEHGGDRDLGFGQTMPQAKAA